MTGPVAAYVILEGPEGDPDIPWKFAKHYAKAFQGVPPGDLDAMLRYKHRNAQKAWENTVNNAYANIGGFTYKLVQEEQLVWAVCPELMTPAQHMRFFGETNVH